MAGSTGMAKEIELGDELGDVGVQANGGPLKQLRVQEAFSAAARVKDSVYRAVVNDFRDSGKYKDTNPFDLSFDEYMLLMLSSIMTFGAAAIAFSVISTALNAKKDDYRHDVHRHFDTMQAKLASLTERLPQGDERRLLENFARRAAYTFHMEKAAHDATHAETFKKGIAEIRAARRFADDSAAMNFLDRAYRTGSFPKPRSFLEGLTLCSMS